MKYHMTNKLNRTNISAICIAPFGIYMRTSVFSNQRIRNHEAIHWKQQMECLIIFFYVWYFVEWLIRLPFGNAYKKLLFEQEAYAKESDPTYLLTRKMFNWIRKK